MKISNDGLIAALYTCLLVWFVASFIRIVPNVVETRANVESYVKVIK